MKKLWLIILLATMSVNAKLTDVNKAELPRNNLLLNPGGESLTKHWTESAGTLSTVSTPSAGKGNTSITWDAAAASDSLISNTFTITDAEKGRASVVRCDIKGASALTHTLQAWNGASAVDEGAITSSTTDFVRTSVYFQMPSSGTIALRIEAQADEALATIDNCFLGTTEPIVSSREDDNTLIAAGRIDCDGGSSITANRGAWMSSVGNIATGECVITVNTGVFRSAPMCTAIARDSTAKILHLTSSGATSLTLKCFDDAGADCTNYDADIMCFGPTKFGNN